MFISDLFEATTLQTLVVIPGGYHPFHPGHLSLYKSAQKAFPGATIVYAATDDQKTRPFPFGDKQKLAQIAGVSADAFQQVRSPFAPREITGQFDPESTVLIFVRSNKDREESPRPGGTKKDGSPAYLQPYNAKHLEPMSKHGYMAYLPAVQFKAGASGVTSATQIREMWPTADDAQKNQIVTDLYPRNPQLAKQILDKNLGQGVAEHIVKVGNEYELKSKKTGKNLGKYPTKAGAEKRERQVQYFKHQGMEEDAAVDPNVIQLKKRAKQAHPFAKNDEEALLLYLADRNRDEFKDIHGEQDREMSIIDRLDQAEHKMETEIQRIDKELAQLLSMTKK
jgi:hypothetical protein